MFYSDKEIAGAIDHTLLKSEATEKDIIRLCEEARHYGFKAVCVQPYYVSLCAETLKDTDVRVASVVGFPFGTNSTEVKILEAQSAFVCGAREIDMVLNISALKNNRIEEVCADIKSVVNVSKDYPGTIVKVIIETALLSKEEKIKACDAVIQGGADFVKTSTGFNGGGATVEDITLIAGIVGDKARIKASGGIRTRQQAEALLRAGASRLGTSGGIKLLNNNY